MVIPLLSKSKFLAGLQCPLRLWYVCYEPDLAAPLTPSQKALFSMGQRVGELARQRYPGGVLIGQNHFHHDDAVRSTREALNGPRTPAIYEAAFTFDGIRIRVDVLERSHGESWNFVEVKSGTSVKEENVYDVAVQYYVLRGIGLNIGQAGILHLNREYVYEGRGLDLMRLFTFSDLKERVAKVQPEIASKIQDLKAPIHANSSIIVGRTCPITGSRSSGDCGENNSRISP